MRCSVEKNIYRTDKGWSVILCKALEPISTPDGKKIQKIYCVGRRLPETVGMEFEAVGEWKQYKGQYQYHVNICKPLISENELEIVRFLSRSICTIRMAKEIYRKFGKNTLEVMRTEPQQLLEIKGFTSEKLQNLMERFHANYSKENQICTLRNFGVNLRAAETAVEKYGEHMLEIIREAPHKLYVDGIISFDLAEQIAGVQDIARDNPIRIQAAAIRALVMACSGDPPFRYSGHTCLPEDALVIYTAYVLGLKKLGQPLQWDIKKRILSMIREMANSDILFGVISKDAKRYYYLMPMGIAEAGIAKKCLEMLNLSNEMLDREALNKTIDKICVEIGIDLNLEQRDAICNCLGNSISIVTGGPGTGKTLIQKVLVLLIKRVFPVFKIALCAPTGVAAQRLAEATNKPASTIHKILQLKVNNEEESDTEKQLPWDVIIIDEFSMVDEMLFYRLLKRLKANTKLILSGDIEQLPSIGAGAVMQDLIRSECISVSRLKHNYRQKHGSMIMQNAQRITRGDCKLEYGEDFVFHEADTFPIALNKLCMEYQQCAAETGIDKVIILVPFRENTETGTEQLNIQLQSLINPPSSDKPEFAGRDRRIFRLGDKVMHRKNGGVVNNGDIGRIVSIKKETQLPVAVMYSEKRLVQYTPTELRHLELSYATTLQRAQGQEYDTVILHLMEAHERMLTRNLIYTGITRAKKRVILVGQQKAIQKTITNLGEKRSTLLCEWLQGKICIYKNGRFKI